MRFETGATLECARMVAQFGTGGLDDAGGRHVGAVPALAVRKFNARGASAEIMVALKQTVRHRFIAPPAP